MSNLRERAETIVAKLYVPHDPARWGESPVSVPELVDMIVAFAQAVQEECAKVADEHETTAREYAEEHNDKDSMLIRANEAQTIAQAIRARGGKL